MPTSDYHQSDSGSLLPLDDEPGPASRISSARANALVAQVFEQAARPEVRRSSNRGAVLVLIAAVVSVAAMAAGAGYYRLLRAHKSHSFGVSAHATHRLPEALPVPSPTISAPETVPVPAIPTERIAS